MTLIRRLLVGYGALLLALIIAGPRSWPRITKWWMTS